MVLYVVCYDLSADVQTQKAQIDKWLGIIGPIFANPGPKKAILGITILYPPSPSPLPPPNRFKTKFEFILILL